MEDLLQLSDEYQVKQLIFDPCVKFLEDQTKTKENVMKIVALANLYNLEKVHQSCIDLLKNMRFESLSETIHLQDLDKEQTQYYLTERIERLETFFDDVYLQFFGVVMNLMLLLVGKSMPWSLCSTHVTSDYKFRQPVSYFQIRNCPDCRTALSAMVENTSPRFEKHFDSNLFSVMEDFSRLVDK